MELRLIDKDRYAVVWKTPASGGRPMAISAQLPERCDPRTPGQPIWNGAAYVARWTANCPGGLEGGLIHIDGLDQTSTDVLVRFDFADGVNQAHRLTASNPSFMVPSQPSRLEVVQTYFLYGVERLSPEAAAQERTGGGRYRAYVASLRPSPHSRSPTASHWPERRWASSTCPGLPSRR